MKVLILGCGPAGMMAAHAASGVGADFIVMSKRRKSWMEGAQYLHKPIPGVSTSPAFRISYQLSGDADGYREKVYGKDSGVEVSPESLVGIHNAWDIREAYDRLWGMYNSAVQDMDIDHQILKSLITTWNPDVTISTIPAQVLCRDASHEFEFSEIWSTNELECALSDDTVLCNGNPRFKWYRASKIQGHTNTEWPYDQYPSKYNGRIWRVTKPISTTCNCFPHVHRMGRYGKWTKGVLSHHAWEEAYDLLLKQAILDM